MKSTIVAVSLLFSVAVQAQPIKVTLIAPLTSSPGTFAKTVDRSIAPSGLTLDLRQAGSCQESLNEFNTLTTPVGMVMTDNLASLSHRQNTDCVPKIDRNTRALIITTLPYALCTKPGKDISPGKSYNIGIHTLMATNSILKEINNNPRNMSFKAVGYRASNAMVLGVTNGDVDMAWIGMSDATIAIKAGSIECRYSSDASHGMRHINDLIGRNTNLPLVAQGSWMILLRNVGDADLAKITKYLPDAANSLASQTFTDTIINVGPKQIEDFMTKTESKRFLD